MYSTSSTPNLLIIDDDENLRDLLIIATKGRGWLPVAANTGKQGRQMLTSEIKAVILDKKLPDEDGIRTLELLREMRPDLPVIMLTGLNEAEAAVRALKSGADDYLTKPFELERLFNVLHNACRIRRQDSTQASEDDTKESERSEPLLSSASPLMREFYRQVRKAATLDITVLLTGESGTGKTAIARTIHRLSQRSGESFVPVSCPALPRELLESELFGHERGAFTGATSARAGRFEQATKGTIFLDEIGDLPAELQPKLLTVLQDREFYRVGGNRIMRSNARIIAATNVNLSAKVSEGTFREDLYYRLNTVELRLPALRERLEDLPNLVTNLLERIAKKRGVPAWRVTDGATEALANHDWPGNIRQLENVLERATAFAEKQELTPHDILPLIDGHSKTHETGDRRAHSLQEVERRAFLDSYHRNGRNKARTARELGIAERTVYNLIKRYDIK